MGTSLSKHDFVPIEGYAFQHWGDRHGLPYEQIRPLTDDAALRVWDRARQLCQAPWADPADATGPLLDLRQLDQWDRSTVRDWLLARLPEGAPPLIVCYQPRCAVVVDRELLCDHWLVFFWSNACVWPIGEDEPWVLLHDGDRFAFARRPG